MKKTQTNLQVTPVKTNGKKRTSGKVGNGLGNGQTFNRMPDHNSRTFETRLQPRYGEMPPLPKDLPQPSFSESSEKILRERYLLKGGNLEVAETISERFWHIAYDIASAGFDFGQTKSQVYDKALTFYKIMVKQQFLPNSPTIMNAGKQNGLQYSACFVLPVEDSLPGIFDSIKYAALIHQTGGGTGFAFSRLRPMGSRVKTTGGVASGPVSFLRVFNAATESIKQGGTRRGANMGILRIDHPDVMHFIRSKADLDDQHQPVYDEIAPFLPSDEIRAHFKTLLLDRQIANFNISCAVTDRFMEAYYKGEDYELIDPHTKEVTGKLNAKMVFDEIINRAWHTGDPGLIFIDRINNSPANPMSGIEEIESTNPCVTGDTLVATIDGWKRADQIKVGDQIGTVLGGGIVDQVEVHENRPVYKITFSDGSLLRATAVHQFHAIVHEQRTKNSANKRFSLISLKDLHIGDLVRVAPAPMPSNLVPDLPDGWEDKDYGFFIGMLLGDGSITPTGLSRNVVKMAVNTDDKEWNELVSTVLKKTGSVVVGLNLGQGRSANLTTQDSHGAALMVKQSLLTPGYSFEKYIPLEYQSSNKAFLSGLLDGLFSTDGNVNLTSTHPFLRFKTTSRRLAEDVRRILLCFGIHGRIATIKKVAEGKIGNRAIISRHTQYELSISGAGVKVFAREIGLSNPDKKRRLQQAEQEFSLTGNTWLTSITSIELDGVEKVYDLHEPISDTWLTEGIVSRGCGEQPLAPWDACNLGSINLGKYVSADGKVDWDGLREVTRLAVEFLDDVVQVNPYTLPQIYDEVHNNRRIGLGVMGFADMLFKMKVAYDSEDALGVAEKVMKFINEEGHIASGELAEKRGPFPNWPMSIYASSSDGSVFKDRPESLAFKPNQLLRNSTITTIAPTGTISIIGDCSSGIEPVFALAYIHRAKGAGDKMRYLTIANKTFTEIAKKQGFYSDDLASKVMEHGSVSGLDDVVPVEWQKVFTTAPQIDPKMHVKMQAIFQKYTDNGVSKTINLPNSATVEDVKLAYLMAWETGCNGITIYRDGSKTTQVLNVSKTLKPGETNGQQVLAQEEVKPESQDSFVHRPMILRGRTYKLQTPVGEGFITINRDENDNPFEVFVNIGKGGMHTMADAEAIGRLVSLSLRLSRNKYTSPQEVAQKIVSQLRGIGANTQVGFGKNRVMSLADAIAKALAEDLAQSAKKEEEGEAIPLNLTIETSDKSFESSEETSNGQLALPVNAQADICPECGEATFVREDGCEKCYSCGFSKC